MAEEWAVAITRAATNNVIETTALTIRIGMVSNLADFEEEEVAIEAVVVSEAAIVMTVEKEVTAASRDMEVKAMIEATVATEVATTKEAAIVEAGAVATSVANKDPTSQRKAINL